MGNNLGSEIKKSNRGRRRIQPKEDHVLEMSELLLGQRFAHGCNSKIYHGLYYQKPVAVKILVTASSDKNHDQDSKISSRLSNQYDTESTVLSRLHHPNVIKFIAATRKLPVYIILTEYLRHGSLRTYLRKIEKGDESESLSSKKVVKIALDVAKGMEYVHSEGVIHRDLKPDNLLMDEDFNVKISDFGVSCEKKHCKPSKREGSYRWMAPEILKKKKYGRKVDVYSFGLILWELVTGRVPFEDMSPEQVAFGVMFKNLRPEIPQECDPAIAALIEDCLSRNPRKRPEFFEIVKVLDSIQRL